MGRRKLNRTGEELREQSRIRNRRFYKLHRKEILWKIANDSSDKVCIERICPRCANPVYHQSKRSYKAAIRKNRLCKNCCLIEIWNKSKHTTFDFISQSIKIHGNCYDYSKVNYTGVGKRVELICYKHGSFSQFAGHHLAGHGCPKCAWNLITSEGWMVDKGSIKFRDWLKNRGYNFHFQYHIPEIHATIDFYDPLSKVIIEYDSKYHHSKSQQEKDRLREKKIIDYLSPREFWRVDEKTKTSRNILSI